MGEFQQTRDGHIAVRLDDGTVYFDTLENFVVDGGPKSELPPGIDERIYTQGRRHALMLDHNVMDGGPMPWPWGDGVITNCATYVAAQKARRDAEIAELNRKIKEQMRAPAP